MGAKALPQNIRLKTNLKFLYTFVILILLFNCDRKQTVEPTESEIIQTEIEKGFLEYWFFPKGSYWVYQLNGWEVFDTVRVTSSSVLYREKVYEFYQEAKKLPHPTDEFH